MLVLDVTSELRTPIFPSLADNFVEAGIRPRSSPRTLRPRCIVPPCRAWGLLGRRTPFDGKPTFGLEVETGHRTNRGPYAHASRARPFYLSGLVDTKPRNSRLPPAAHHGASQ